MQDTIVIRLLDSSEPSVRYKVQTSVLGYDSQAEPILRLREEVRAASLVGRLLGERQPDGGLPYFPYAKWYGAHWVLAALADLGYPPGDESLTPLCEQELGWLLGEKHKRAIKTIDGRVRRCASQEGNALYALLALGLADERLDELASRLVRWQWPDGGWNCDENPAASHSSFMETLIPLRGLALHARLTGNLDSKQAAERAAEIFLKRGLFVRQRDGAVIDKEFLRLHYPCYWHYDILFGLKVMAEAGFIRDHRCNPALDLLESKRLPDGGWPAEGKYYRFSPEARNSASRVDWGGTSKLRLNEFVSADALAVLSAAGRLK